MITTRITTTAGNLKKKWKYFLKLIIIQRKEKGDDFIDSQKKMKKMKLEATINRKRLKKKKTGRKRK